MNISRTDLNLFVVFEAIYTHGGVTRAAEVLNLSQPAISHALNRLRERMGDPLFTRAGQRLAPTPLAQRMIGPTREALRLFARTLGESAGFDPATAEMSFTLGMRALMESTYLLPLILLANRAAPAVTLASSPIDRRRIEPALASGELDAVIDVFVPLSDEIRRSHLSQSPAVVVARRGHPAVEGAIDLDTYLAADHVLVTSRPRGLGAEDIALSRIGATRRIRTRCQQLGTAMRLVASSNLLVTMSESFARAANIWFDHQILPAPFEAGGLDTYLYWHAKTEAEPAHVWLREAIRTAAQPSPSRVTDTAFSTA